MFEAASARDIDSYNKAVTEKEHGDEYGPGTMPVPRIVVVVDDLADLIVCGAYETEQALTQLAQESGAVGIHLIVNARRLTANVLTGTILNAFSHRVALQVSSSVESRVLTSMPDAKDLDLKSMLFVEFENRSLKSSLRLKVHKMAAPQQAGRARVLPASQRAGDEFATPQSLRQHSAAESGAH